MADYIDRSKIRYTTITTETRCHNDYYTDLYNVAMKEDIEKIPTADVRENVYSSWKIFRFNDGTTYADCLNCKITQVFYGGKEPTNFCPNCGADMRERRRKKHDG